MIINEDVTYDHYTNNGVSMSLNVYMIHIYLHCSVEIWHEGRKKIIFTHTWCTCMERQCRFFHLLFLYKKNLLYFHKITQTFNSFMSTRKMKHLGFKFHLYYDTWYSKYRVTQRVRKLNRNSTIRKLSRLKILFYLTKISGFWFPRTLVVRVTTSKLTLANAQTT